MRWFCSSIIFGCGSIIPSTLHFYIFFFHGFTICCVSLHPVSAFCTITPPSSPCRHRRNSAPPTPLSSLAGHRPDAQPRAGRRGPVLLGLAGPPQQRVAAGAVLWPVGGLGLWLHLDEPQLQDGLGAAQELHLAPELRNVTVLPRCTVM